MPKTQFSLRRRIEMLGDLAESEAKRDASFAEILSHYTPPGDTKRLEEVHVLQQKAAGARQLGAIFRGLQDVRLKKRRTH